MNSYVISSLTGSLVVELLSRDEALMKKSLVHLRRLKVSKVLNSVRKPGAFFQLIASFSGLWRYLTPKITWCK